MAAVDEPKGLVAQNKLARAWVVHPPGGVDVGERVRPLSSQGAYCLSLEAGR